MWAEGAATVEAEASGFDPLAVSTGQTGAAGKQSSLDSSQDIFHAIDAVIFPDIAQGSWEVVLNVITRSYPDVNYNNIIKAQVMLVSTLNSRPMGQSFKNAFQCSFHQLLSVIIQLPGRLGQHRQGGGGWEGEQYKVGQIHHH